jgi:hypothetical protein
MLDKVNEVDFDKTTLYVIRCGPYYKIGISEHPVQRLRILSGSVPFKVHYVHHKQLRKFYARRFERVVHNELKDERHRGEWFQTELSTIKKAIAKANSQVTGWWTEYHDLKDDKSWIRALSVRKP